MQSPVHSPALLVGWTTVETEDQARTIAQELIEARLAVCVQIDSPVTSHYWWEGKPERSTEFRIWVKLLPENLIPIERWLHCHHPYTVPQWIAVSAAAVGGKYLSWARQSPTS